MIAIIRSLFAFQDDFFRVNFESAQSLSSDLLIHYNRFGITICAKQSITITDSLLVSL